MIRVSNKAMYAIKALADLTLAGDEARVSLREMSDVKGVSKKYLETIFASLRLDGIVRSRRGIGGGYTLAKKPESISLFDVVMAVDRISDAKEMRFACWRALDAEIMEFLSVRTLLDFAKDLRRLEGKKV